MRTNVDRHESLLVTLLREDAPLVFVPLNPAPVVLHPKSRMTDRVPLASLLRGPLLLDEIDDDRFELLQSLVGLDVEEAGAVVGNLSVGSNHNPQR